MDADLVQITAVVPGGLKRAAFARFALTDTKFTHWLRDELQRYVASAPALRDDSQPTRREPHAQQR